MPISGNVHVPFRFNAKQHKARKKQKCYGYRSTEKECLIAWLSPKLKPWLLDFWAVKPPGEPLGKKGWFAIVIFGEKRDQKIKELNDQDLLGPVECFFGTLAFSFCEVFLAEKEICQLWNSRILEESEQPGSLIKFMSFFTARLRQA